jgi:hypothetical protein
MYSTGDIILERWLPYEARTGPRTIRIPAASGQLPDSPRNLIIEYQPSQVSIFRELQRFDVTGADPQAYIQQHGGTLVNSAKFLQRARATRVFEDIVSFALFYLFYRTLITSFSCII